VEVASHRLMLRAGMIRQLAAGVYDVLPLGLRCFRKVEAIIRDEMNRAGGQELSLPYVQPADIWKETGRWESNGKELLRFQDRHGRDFCLGPTHEEVITELVRDEIRSYKELPQTFYQIQLKFRDEVRPRFGLMRGREFIMKDAYSFDATEQGLDESYQAMRAAYHAIFKRCGLRFRSVQADSGNIGGSASEEFMVMASSGEDAVVFSQNMDYAANVEKAQSREFVSQLPKETFTALEKKHTPQTRTIEDVCKRLELHPKETVKTLLYKADQQWIALVLPGDRQVNELALPALLKAETVIAATEKEVQGITDIPFGSLGPIDLQKKIPAIETIYYDTLVHEGRHYALGANEADYHWVGAKAGEDFKLEHVLHFHLVQDGDQAMDSDQALTIERGIEVGHIFKLGTKYSQAMNAQFLDPDGKLQPFIMGCYGIGVGRTLAAAIEQNHDDDGIIFPPQLAPFDVAVLPIKWKSERLQKAAVQIYENLQKAGMDVLLDDRDAGYGMKRKDADLIGIPITITVGDRGLDEGKVEVGLRWSDDKHMLSPEALLAWCKQALDEGLPS
jgi:prolyl-tRNA synthetase